jgi:FtsZ-binding cell division protein ZapB
MRTIWLLIACAVLTGCVSTKELQEQIAYLQKQNKDLQKQISPPVPATPQANTVIDPLYMRMLDDLGEENAALQGEKAALKTENTALQGEKAALKTENAALQGEKAALKTENTALQGEKAALKTENTALQGEKAALKTENTALQGEKAALKTENTALQDEKATLKTENAALETKNAALEKDTKEAVQTLSSTITQLKRELQINRVVARE